MSFWDWALGYGIVAVLFIFVGAMLMSGTWKDKQDGARIIFLCPAWPAILAYWAFIGVRALWDAADFRSNR